MRVLQCTVLRNLFPRGILSCSHSVPEILPFDNKLQDSYLLNSDWYTDFISTLLILFTLCFMGTLVFAY